MNPFKEYLEDLLGRVSYKFPNLTEETLKEALSKFKDKIPKDDAIAPFLGAGVESTVHELGPENIVKFGPKFEKIINFKGDPSLARTSAGQALDKELQGRLEPLSEFPFDASNREAINNYVVATYPKATTYNPDKDSEETRLMDKVLSAYKTGRGIGWDRESGWNLPARSYRAADLHSGNIGYVPGQGVVSIDTNAGLFEGQPFSGYPRQGYLIGGNLLERWADEVAQPHLDPGMLERLLIEKLSKLNASSYPSAGDTSRFRGLPQFKDYKNINSLDKLPIQQQIKMDVTDATPDLNWSISPAPTSSEMKERERDMEREIGRQAWLALVERYNWDI